MVSNRERATLWLQHLTIACCLAGVQNLSFIQTGSVLAAEVSDTSAVEKEQKKEQEKADKEERKQKEKQEKQEKKEREEDKKEKKDQKDEAAKGADRSEAPCLSWVPVGIPVKAVLLCVHGLGLNSDSWKEFGQAMSQLGVATYAIDVRGFGSWMKAPETKMDFSQCISDVQVMLNWLHKSNANKPVFLMGESMGGAIVLHSAAQYPSLMNGVISVCSSGDRFKQKRTDLNVFVHMLMGPHRKFDIGDKIVDQAAGDDVALKREWEGDSLDKLKLSPVELMQFQHFMNDNHDEVKRIVKLPVLMVQGSADKLVKPEGTQELYDELKTPDKQIIMVPDAKHLIFEEQQFNNDTLSQVANWIFRHCPPDPFGDAMERARLSIQSGNFNVAQNNMRVALKLNPNDANAHYQMGIVQMRMGHPLIARQHLVLATRLGRGNQVARDANKSMMTLPQNILAPRRIMRPGRKPAFAQSGQPTVLIFNANWCQPCQDMNKVVEEAKQRAGNRVKFQTVDVDDPANADLVEQYSIGPVPTTVFLAPNGDVANFQVGFAGVDGMIKGLQKFFPNLH